MRHDGGRTPAQGAPAPPDRSALAAPGRLAGARRPALCDDQYGRGHPERPLAGGAHGARFEQGDRLAGGGRGRLGTAGGLAGPRPGNGRSPGGRRGARPVGRDDRRAPGPLAVPGDRGGGRDRDPAVPQRVLPAGPGRPDRRSSCCSRSASTWWSAGPVCSTSATSPSIAIGAYTTGYFTRALPVKPPFHLNPFFVILRSRSWSAWSPAAARAHRRCGCAATTWRS